MPRQHRASTRLDPRQPLVLDTRELGRGPGSMCRVQRDVPAPRDLGLELVTVPAGAALQLRLRLEAVMEGVLVSGTVTAPLVGECGRCLDPVAATVAVDLQELFAYPDRALENACRLEGDLLDLEPVLRDAVVLALPLTPLCQPDCPGLCPACGGRLADLGAGHGHPAHPRRPD